MHETDVIQTLQFQSQLIPMPQSPSWSVPNLLKQVRTATPINFFMQVPTYSWLPPPNAMRQISKFQYQRICPESAGAPPALFQDHPATVDPVTLPHRLSDATSTHRGVVCEYPGPPSPHCALCGLQVDLPADESASPAPSPDCDEDPPPYCS